MTGWGDELLAAAQCGNSAMQLLTADVSTINKLGQQDKTSEDQRFDLENDPEDCVKGQVAGKRQVQVG